MTRIIILVLFTALSYTRTHHYKVEFMGVNVAAVTMAHRDTIFENRAATIVEFTATTESVSNYFFPVDNYYEIIHSIDSQQILSFSKKFPKRLPKPSTPLYLSVFPKQLKAGNSPCSFTM